MKRRSDRRSRGADGPPREGARHADDPCGSTAHRSTVNPRHPMKRPIDFDELRRRITRAVDRVCPSWLKASRDDLIQAAVLRVIEVHKKGEGEGHFSTSYLRKVAYAVLVDEVRRIRRRSEVPLEAEAPSEAPRSPDGESSLPERKAVQRQLGCAIAECLRDLRDERRQALVLYLQGHSVPDAARILGWSTKKTENLVYRGRSDLQRCLREKGFTP